MRWTKRLKWIRASKIIIPIALAISIVFAGFAVFATEAENFVVKVKNETGVNLSLTFNEDLTEQTDHLIIPVNGRFIDTTWYPASKDDAFYQDSLYDPNRYANNLPDDIAQHEGIHSVYFREGRLSFFSASFYLVNNSERVVGVDMAMYIEEMITADTPNGYHLDDAVRIMLIEGKPLISDNAGVYIYKKPEASQENEDKLKELIEYGDYSMQDFVSSSCILSWSGENGELLMESGEVRRFTVVIWVEGHDNECVDEILPEQLKLSFSFDGK